MTKYNWISLEKEGRKAMLTLRRPPLNILNIEMMKEINEALEAVKNDDSVNVLIIKGDGKCFSAGVDIGEHIHEKVRSMLTQFHKMFHLLAQIDIPTIAMVHGSALGGGMELACFTDMTFATKDAKLGQPEIKVGVIPPLAAACFPKISGWKHSSMLLLTGDIVSPKKAYEVGLITEVVNPKKLESRVKEVSDTFAGLSLPVLKHCKRAMRRGAARPFAQALEDIETLYINDLMTTHDANEGLAAFLEKRPPRWQHR